MSRTRKPERRAVPRPFPIAKCARDFFAAARWVLRCSVTRFLWNAWRSAYGTPLYVYSASTIRERMASFEHAFRKVPHTVCYSVKANSSLGILRLLAGMGCGFDVVSGGELERVLRVDRRAAKRVVFSGVGKTAEEMQAALKAGVMLFNVESESELWRLAECAARTREKARIALRVNPDVPANTHPYISTGLQQHKFGIPIGKARKLYAQASGTKYLRIAGVSVHIGSQITDVQPFALAMERVAELVRVLQEDGHRIEYVDAGGGLGIDYEDASPEGFAGQAAEYAAALLRPLAGIEGSSSARARPLDRGAGGRSADSSALPEDERPQTVSGGGCGDE